MLNKQLNATFLDKKILYRAYMPFVQQGGIFISTQMAFEYGETLDLCLQLFDETEKIMMPVKVIWVTPPGAEGGRPVGVGVQFLGENAKSVCQKIETYLSGLSPELGTYTL